MEACVDSRCPLNCSLRKRFWIRSIRPISDLYSDSVAGQANPTTRRAAKKPEIIHFSFNSHGVFIALYFSEWRSRNRSNRSAVRFSHVRLVPEELWWTTVLRQNKLH
jgi:hypothetical protein